MTRLREALHLADRAGGPAPWDGALAGPALWDRSSGLRSLEPRAPGLARASAPGPAIADRGIHRVEGACLRGPVREDSPLCTELVPGDGPVALLARAGGSALVRGRDGTVGWMRGPLGPSVEPPGRAGVTCPEGQASARLARALRSHLGAPYRLGGTTRAQVDCSGLVQRCVREALGVVLPRHSGDQLQVGVAPARALGEPGDLLFLWSRDESPCHVGVVLEGERPGRRTIVHASSRRGRVIEEPLERVLTRASQIRHIELEQVLALRP